MATERRNKTGAELQAEVLAKIAQFSDKNRPLAERMHQLIMEAAPTLHSRLWYGVPGYAKTKDGAVILFFREDKYMTFGFTESVQFLPKAGAVDLLMPCAWFFTDLDNPTEQRITEIVRGAIAE